MGPIRADLDAASGLPREAKETALVFWPNGRHARWLVNPDRTVSAGQIAAELAKYEPGATIHIRRSLDARIARAQELAERRRHEPFPPGLAGGSRSAMAPDQIARHQVDPVQDVTVATGPDPSLMRAAYVDISSPTRVRLALYGTQDQVEAQAASWVAANRPGAKLWVMPTFDPDEFEARAKAARSFAARLARETRSTGST